MRSCVLVVVSGVLACGPGVSSSGSGDSSSTAADSTGSSGTGGSSTTGDDHGDRMPLPVNRDAAILFVIDDSASMAAKQGRLARAGDAFWEPLAHANANLRIAFTSTDNGNPWCD